MSEVDGDRGGDVPSKAGALEVVAGKEAETGAEGQAGAGEEGVGKGEVVVVRVGPGESEPGGLRKFFNEIDSSDQEEIRKRSEETEAKHDDAYYLAMAERYGDEEVEDVYGGAVDGQAGGEADDPVGGEPDSAAGDSGGEGMARSDGAENRVRRWGRLAVSYAEVSAKVRSGRRSELIEPLAGEDAGGPKPGKKEGAKPGAVDMAAFESVLNAGIAKLERVNSELVAHVAEAMQNEVELLKQAIPKPEDGAVGTIVAATERLGEQVGAYTEDFHRWRETHRGRNRWLLIGGIVAAVPALLVLGVLLQERFGLMELARGPVPDPTNGWKNIVWSAHGREVATCMKEAERTGAAVPCRITAQPE